MAKRSKKKRSLPSVVAGKPEKFAFQNQSIWSALLLAAVTFLVFWPSLKSDLVYDAYKEIVDEGFITHIGNLPAVLSLKVLGMNVMLADRPGQLLYLMLIASVSGKAPFGYHLGSNLLHATNVALLFLFLQQLLTTETVRLDKSGAWKVQIASLVVALIFALHPLSVESIAEVSYSSSLLVTFFTLLALLAAMAFRPENKRSVLLAGSLGTLCALAAVTAKESGIATSIILVVYWYLFRRKETKGPWLWFLGSATFVTLIFLAARFSFAAPIQGHLNYLGGDLSQVVLIQPRLWVFMMGKLVWPTHLSADYTPADQIGPSTLIALPILAGVIGLQGWLAVKSRLGALGVAIYWAGLATVSNVEPLYRPLADRFYYLPLVGVSLQLLALLLMALPYSRLFWGLLIFLVLALIPLTSLNLQRQAVFADNFSLWTDTLRESPLSTVAHTGMGWALYQKGQFDAAVTHYETAISINPNFAEVHNNLGLALFQKGQLDEAMAEYQKAEALNPGTAQIPNNLGLALAQKGQLDDAMVQYEKALRLNPGFVEAHNNLGMALAQKGRLDEAIVQYQETLHLAPEQAETHNNLAIVLAQKGEMAAAVAEFREAVRLKPDYVTAQNNLARAEASLNQSPGAK